MLVVSRKQGEALRIGPDVVVKIVSLGATQVKLAIEAPAEVSIHREEVYARIAEANLAAASGPDALPQTPGRRHSGGDVR